jgi:hypothetical protein
MGGPGPTDLVAVNGMLEGTRLIVRREPLHPGAQHSLFPSTNYRYRGHWTDQHGDAVTLDVTMRAHAHVEDHIRRLKDSGLCRFPFRDLDANRAWLATVCHADGLVRWFQPAATWSVAAVLERWGAAPRRAGSGAIGDRISSWSRGSRSNRSR